ncbi:hypothetical protein [Pedobacter montanisoli]|uniref:FAD-dependent oxidoreductase n=1 Tax=Pedobacter montanisoli TaxID=2923277 RepID=A0ABS9ZT65_9SPHI|nr:hypothetical protein [Pedobacter montanisoli]MCJ0741784.1 hypothetical protein [Pedobacter montanisoli]
MKKLFVFTLILFFTFKVFAQTQKTDVLVIGNNNAAVSAAIQAVQSDVKVILLLQAGGFDIEPVVKDINSGIQLNFVNKLATKENFNKQEANAALTQMTDSLKKLTVIKNVSWIKAGKSGNGWSLTLSNGQSIKAKILINTADIKLNNTLKINAAESQIWQQVDYLNNIYRTSVAGGKTMNNSNITQASLYRFLIPQQESFLWLTDNSMLSGQAAGAIAAYSAFFNVKLSLVDVKKIQGELIKFKLNLIPFADIQTSNPNWAAIQKTGVMGIIKGQVQNDQLYFMPEKEITTEEIKQPLKDHFYKAQIWFDDHTKPSLSLNDALDLVCYTGNKSKETTEKEVQKKWKTTYAFKTDFDLNKIVTRQELAVLLQDYTSPFLVNTDKEGNIQR